VEIGTEKKAIIVEPLEDPFDAPPSPPQPTPAPAPPVEEPTPA
jgi:hypothetical protein